ncbi:hypothetical protein E2C01_064682 [Portunus trituberculatus]|uniref:Uncharacterized protein n=1 Tax=Portunus trituberculatus TaxID=210409 RepID=A0A5B7HPF8_PORTR|nr:hypothetical protein [Portunus trituberculatus]
MYRVVVAAAKGADSILMYSTSTAITTPSLRAARWNNTFYTSMGCFSTILASPVSMWRPNIGLSSCPLRYLKCDPTLCDPICDPYKDRHWDLGPEERQQHVSALVRSATLALGPALTRLVLRSQKVVCGFVFLCLYVFVYLYFFFGLLFLLSYFFYFICLISCFYYFFYFLLYFLSISLIFSFVLF